MSGNGSDDDSYFSDDEVDPQAMLFSPAYQRARAPQEAREAELRDAVKAKVDDIIVELQKHASKISYNSSSQSSTAEVGYPEQPIEEVVNKINALISTVRRQYISSARREDGGMTELDHAMMAVLMRLRRELKTPYVEILENFLKNEVDANSIMISKGDSKDPFLHYLYEHPEAKKTISKELIKDYTAAVDEHFISNTADTLRAVELVGTGIQQILGAKGGEHISAMRLALATASGDRTKAAHPHPRLN